MTTTSLSTFIHDVTQRNLESFPGICFQCRFAAQNYHSRHVDPLLKHPLPPSLHAAVDKRKAEFVAGRYLARLALLELGESQGKVDIAKNRAPAWPANVVGSISHTESYAICVVARQHHCKQVGIDVEKIIDIKTAQSIVESIICKDEHAFVYRNNQLNLEMLTLVFSAKESLFKALYPEVGFYFGFEAAVLTNIDAATNKFTLVLTEDLTMTYKRGLTFTGHFVFEQNCVLTMLSIA